MRAILIDPMFKKLQEVEYSGNYKDIYKLIGYDDIIMDDRVLMKGYRPTAFDGVRIPIGFDGIYVDDEGLYAPLQFRWSFQYGAVHEPIRLCNKALVLGCDDNGDSIEPDSTLDDMRAMITWDWKSEKQEVYQTA